MYVLCTYNHKPQWVKCIIVYPLIHETVQLMVMHATHTVTFLVRLDCRGNAVQFKEMERERKTEKEEKKTT